MKKFRDLLEKDAKDYVGDGESQKDYEAASDDEQKFKNLHSTQKANLIMPKDHPVAPDYVFSGEIPKKESGKGEPILKKYSDFVSGTRSAAKPGGDKTPVMQGSSKIKEEVELNEKQKPMVSFDRDGVHVMNSSGKIHKSFKDKRLAMAYFKKNYDKLMKEEADYIDEAFKKGMLKLKDGKTVKIDEKTAKFLNDAMKQLNPGNRKKMETEAKKDKKSFDAMVDFAKAAA